MLSLFNLHLDNQTCDVGYWLAAEKQGQGIISLSVAYTYSHVFQTLEKHKLIIRVATDNLKSRRIPERLGFTHEATLRDNEKLGEQYVSHAVYSLLKNEWQQQLQQPSDNA